MQLSKFIKESSKLIFEMKAQKREHFPPAHNNLFHYFPS